MQKKKIKTGQLDVAFNARPEYTREIVFSFFFSIFITSLSMNVYMNE